MPKGWDRLFVSIVSAESGRTIAKLGKALVKNGSCLWSEAISESIYISRHDSSKSFEDCLVKFVVSTVHFRFRSFSCSSYRLGTRDHTVATMSVLGLNKI